LKHMTTHAGGGFGWRGRVAVAGMIWVFAMVGGCAQRPDILREAGAKEVQLKVVRMSFPRSLGISALISKEVEVLESCAGVSVMSGQRGYEEELAARFSWMEGFRQTSSHFTMLDLGSVAPVLWEARAEARPSRSVLHASISQRVQLSLATEPYRLKLVMTDVIKPLEIRVPRRSYEDGRLALVLVPRLSEGRAVVRFCPLIVRDGRDFEELRGFAFSADASAEEALVLASAGASGSFGERAFLRRRGTGSVKKNIVLPLSPPSEVVLRSGVRSFYDELLVVMPIFEEEP